MSVKFEINVWIFGIGFFIFSEFIMNEEFVVFFNEYVCCFNEMNVDVIVLGVVVVFIESLLEFIFKVFGIE